MMNTLGKIIIILAVVLMGVSFFAEAVLAETFNLEYPDFVNPEITKTPAEFINKLYIYALGISGTLAVMMIVYGGVKYAINPGNTSAQGDATDIIKNAVFGVVLLAGAYLILETINPSLVILKNPGLEMVPVSTSTEGTTPPPTKEEATELIRVAKWLLDNEGGKFSFSVNATCGSISHAKGNLTDVSNGELPLVCSPDCVCKKGGTSGTVTLNLKMLKGLQFIVINSTVPKSVITSFTGGKHSTTSQHYQGNAADFSPVNTSPDQWDKLLTSLRNPNAGEASLAKCEARKWTDTNGNGQKDSRKSESNPNGDEYSTEFYNFCSDLFNNASYLTGKLDNIHIHANW